MSKKGIVTLSTFLIGLGVATWSVTTRVSSFQEQPQPPAFSALFQILTPDEDGEMHVSAIRIRHQRADGGWREETFRIDPEEGQLVRESTFVSSPERGGTFRVGRRGLHFAGGPSRGQAVTADQFLKSPQFVREDEVAGIKTYVLKYAQTPEGIYVHHAPELGPVLVKIIEPDLVQELVTFFPGEPAKEIMELPELPVATDGYEEMIAGSPAKTATVMEETLGRFEEKEAKREQNKVKTQ